MKDKDKAIKKLKIEIMLVLFFPLIALSAYLMLENFENFSQDKPEIIKGQTTDVYRGSGISNRYYTLELHNNSYQEINSKLNFEEWDFTFYSDLHSAMIVGNSKFKYMSFHHDELNIYIDYEKHNLGTYKGKIYAYKKSIDGEYEPIEPIEFVYTLKRDIWSYGFPLPFLFIFMPFGVLFRVDDIIDILRKENEEQKSKDKEDDDNER